MKTEVATLASILDILRRLVWNNFSLVSMSFLLGRERGKVLSVMALCLFQEAKAGGLNGAW